MCLGGSRQVIIPWGVLEAQIHKVCVQIYISGLLYEEGSSGFRAKLGSSIQLHNILVKCPLLKPEFWGSNIGLRLNTIYVPLSSFVSLSLSISFSVKWG